MPRALQGSSTSLDKHQLTVDRSRGNSEPYLFGISCVSYRNIPSNLPLSNKTEILFETLRSKCVLKASLSAVGITGS